jgi:hypothetical protein
MLSKYNLRWLYTSDFIQTIDYYAKSLHEKVLPSFSDIAEEADRVEKETANQLSSFDPADIAEHVIDAGVDFTLMAHGVVQGIINMFTAGLYHLFEQQLLWLYRQELLWEWFRQVPPVNLLNKDLLTVVQAQKRLLQDYKIDLTVFTSWSTLEELRLVANVVKHADGRSCDDLKQRRLDLFIHPTMKDETLLDDSILRRRPVYQPLSGEDIYISPEEFTRYVEATKKFWQEFAEAVDQLPG